MDRRGRGTSGDGADYALSLEYADVTAVATYLAHQKGGPVDVFAHSYGATCTIGAAASGAPFRRIALYEPPGPETVSRDWLDCTTALIAAGHTGRAMVGFLIEIIGLTRAQVEELKNTPGAGDVLPILAHTLSREAEALVGVDLPGLAAAVSCPVLLLLGTRSPGWAATISQAPSRALPDAELAVLPDVGHEALDLALELIVQRLDQFFSRPRPGAVRAR